MRGFYMAGVVVFVFCLCSCAPQNIISDSQSPDKPDAFSLDAGGKKLSKSLTDSLRRQNPGKIAVVGFEGPGQKITPFGEYLSEKLSLRLCNNPVFPEIMERKELDRIIQAHNLEYGLFFDQDTVEDFGKLIGADSIVIGKIQDLGTSYDVTVKAVEAATGRILGMAEVLIDNNASVQKLLEKSLQCSLTVQVKPPAEGTIIACGRKAEMQKGSHTFTEIPYGACQVTVQAAGFEPRTRKLSLHAPTQTTTFKLGEKRNYSVAFQVVPPDATLSIEGKTVELNDNGYARIKNLKKQDYSYFIRSEGYENRLGRFNPASRPIIQLELKTADSFYQTKKIFFKKIQKIGDKPDFGIKLWADRKEYKLGKNIVFYFKAERDCYLNLVDINSRGEISLIFPNRFHKNNFVEGGRTYQIPGPEYGFYFQVDPPVGKDRIYAVASTAPLDIFSGDFDQTGFMTLTRKSGSQGRVRGIGVKMEQAKLDAAQELVIRITP